MASPYSCDNTGVVDIAASIELIKANQSNTGTIYFPHGTYKLSTNLTIPTGMSIEREAGSMISIDLGVTLTIGCPINGPQSQFFTGNGSVIFQSTFKQEIKPHWFASLTAAVAAASTNEHFLVIPRGAWPVAADLSVPSTCYVFAQFGADIQIANTKTLTFAGNNFEAGRYQCFTLTGTGAVAGLDKAYPEWFGAVGDGTTDCTDPIKAAIASMSTIGGIVDFDFGAYLVTPGEVVVSDAGVLLNGKAEATDGLGTILGTSIKSAAGTGALIAFEGVAAATPVDSCQINDIALDGQQETVIGLSLKWVSNFRSRNVWVNECYDDGVYMEQVWDSSFYDLEVESCGAQGTGKVGLHIYNGTVGNCNNLRFYSFHGEINYGDDVWIDSSAAGTDTGGNHNILFIGGKCEKSQEAGTYSTKAFKISGFDGADGFPNQDITIQNVMIAEYMVAGDIGIHFAGHGFMTVNDCIFTNNTDGGTGIEIEGPVLGPHTHLITNNNFSLVAQEITIDTATCPRNRVWTDMNSNSYYLDTDSRININTDLVLDRRRFVLASVGEEVETSGTGEDDLNSVTLPASLLSTHGGISVYASGTVTGAAGDKTIKFYFGSEVVSVFPAGALTTSWQLEVKVWNITTGAQALFWRLTVDGAPATVNSGVVYPLEDTTADVTIKLTGECANAGDTILQYLWSVKEE